VPLTGDASDRRYFRAIFPGGTADSMVLAVHAGPITFETLPFAKVSELLHRIELPSPAILGHSDADGIVALQDLGDVTCNRIWAPRRPPSMPRCTASGCDHRHAAAPGAEFAGEDYPPFQVAFDVEKLTWELEFFVRHFVTALRGVTLSAAQQAALSEEWNGLADELASEPRGVMSSRLPQPQSDAARRTPLPD
jgi:aminoglycoside/choline kinase family phosphotransferase